MTQYPLILAIDLGTTNIQTIIRYKRTNPRASIPQTETINPTPEIDEEDPKMMWKATIETIKESFKVSKILSFRLIGSQF